MTQFEMINVSCTNNSLYFLIDEENIVHSKYVHVYV